jgi:deoxyribodipyrimidine photo-lyase
MSVLLWLRRDLRLGDQAALAAAVATGRPVIPVYIWAPEEDDPPPGAASRWWLHQSLRALGQTLRAHGSSLILRRGPSAEALLRLAAETSTGAVFYSRLPEPAAIARDRQVEAELRGHGLSVTSFPANLLFDPGAIAGAGGKPFQVFTAYWNASRRAPPPHSPRPAPARIAAPGDWPASLPLEDLQLEPTIDWAGGLRECWQPGEAGALDRLGSFDPQPYDAVRDHPDREGTSRLSPHLHFGEISVRDVWEACRGAEPYLRQVVWREFAHDLLFHFPQTVREPLRPEFRRFPWEMDARLFRAWTRGRTGYPLVDAGMRQLWHTGWMHNRVRLVVASFLVKHLLIPWQEGAAWFWDTLVDADLANNTLGWQWTAGCGADAAPYFRIFNPTLQAEKFDPEGAYIRRWVPEIGTPAYPRPIVDHKSARARALEAYSSIRTA